MKEKFYEKALPTQGTYCVSGIKNGQVINRFTGSLADLNQIIEQLKIEHYNVFVALHSFNTASRKSEHAAFARSFFIDLDVGESDKKYASKYEALEALGEFVDNIALPLPVVVDSGTGVHAYWLLDADIPSLEWKPYAEKFKAFCLERIKIDPAITADKSRIMRCPESFNYKTDPPSPTVFLTQDFTQHSLSLFKDLLGEVDTSVVEVLAQAKKGLDQDTLKLIKSENIETLFSTIATKSLEGAGCNQIRYVLEQSKTLSEPMWHSGLSIARQCADWEESVILMSEDYPGYNREATLQKANETYDKPHSCEVFESRNPGGCDGCPHRGKITNPLALGRRLKEPDPEADPVRVVKNTEGVLLQGQFPDALKPFRRGATGGIYFAPPDADPVLLWPNDLYPVKRMYGPRDGECMLMRHVLPHDDPREFLIQMSGAYSQDEIQQTLGTYGIFPKPHLVKFMKDYIIYWAAYMVNLKTAEQTRGQMGWTDDYEGFVVGNTEYRRDGSKKQTAASPFIHSITKLLGTAGSYDKWRAAVNKMNTEGLEMVAWGLLCGFGSPLIRYTHINGVNVCFTGEAGSGKSGSLFAALSLFGDPKGLSLSGTEKSAATANALVQWMMGLKNLCMGLDEASNRKPEELSNLIYKVSEGKSKLRMQASTDALREIESMSALINFMCANQSPTAKLASLKGSPDGELARLIEFEFFKPEPFRRNPGLAPEIYEAVRLNYGHAGPPYIQAILKLGDDVVHAKISKWVQRFNTDFGGDTAYRFYDALMGVTFAGGEIAKEAGIIDLDLERIYRVMLKEIMGTKEGSVKLNDIDYESLLGDFQNRNAGSVLILRDGRVVDYPRAALVARIEIDEDMYYVSRSAFREYLKNLQVDEKAFIRYMKNKGVLVYVTQSKGDPKFRLTNGWSGHSATSPVSVLGFKGAIPAEVLDKKDGN